MKIQVLEKVMQPLNKEIRSKLERIVKNARDIAEKAACNSLEHLGVGEADLPKHLTEEERSLRRSLRVYGRQVGDAYDSKTKIQGIDLLLEEVAYEHWHRLLFARFLAENNLLMYPDPDHPVPITLEECNDLAKEEGAKNGWDLASRFAAIMLPQIFRPDTPIFQLELPPEYQQKLERLLDDLPTEVFTASDSLGWVYQFWQSKQKDEINKSEVKIGARELPAVTQLFTEPYMVNFLLDNSLGAWWASHMLTEADLANALDEQELKEKVRLPGVSLDYLRFVKENDKWRPAAGDFEKWPEDLSELKVLDPCCGSGHFLVSALLMLIPMRMELQKISGRDAVDAVLRENLNGLEIDKRCVELAAFALAFTAWRYPGAGGYRVLPELNLACSGLPVSGSKEEWQKLANGDNNLRIALGLLHDEFKEAPTLGSLLNLGKGDVAKLADWKDFEDAVTKALEKERSDEEREVGIVAHGLAKAAVLLADKYHWVITNVPYLARGKQEDKLRDYCAKHYKNSKKDLATVFLERCLEFCEDGGSPCVVLPQNWLFLTTYKKLREKLLKNDTWNLIARLGEGGFESSAAAGAFIVLLTLSKGNRNGIGDGIFGKNSALLQENYFSGIDASTQRTVEEKAVQLVEGEVKLVEQEKQLDNPDARITLEEETGGKLLSVYADSYVGIQTGDDPRYVFSFWSFENINFGEWESIQSTPTVLKSFAGCENLIRWEKGEGELHHSSSARLQGLQAVGKPGIMVHRMRKIYPYHFSKTRFHQNCAVIVPKDLAHLQAIWCFCSSPGYNEAVRRIDQKLNVTNVTLVKVPFDLDHWTKVAQEKYPNGLPKPYSEDPTQWIFHGHPVKSDAPLQIAVARLLGYRWPSESDKDMELSEEARAWVNKCDDLLSLSDKDGIVCIPPVRGEASAADRLFAMLEEAYGVAWTTDKLAELLNKVDHSGQNLESWLRKKFFSQHCKLFHNRPFIWHIWDGLHDGFAALVNYHKFDAKLLETLIYTYLGDWINRQKENQKNDIDGSEEKIVAAENLKKNLEMILQGEKPYDIFVRWKSIEQQPIGWNPDLNDGIRLNIRPFLTVPDVGKKGAGILRDKPNIKWNKDRGKDVESAPWYYKFKGDRINDYHLGLDEKQIVRSHKL